MGGALVSNSAEEVAVAEVADCPEEGQDSYCESGEECCCQEISPCGEPDGEEGDDEHPAWVAVRVGDEFDEVLLEGCHCGLCPLFRIGAVVDTIVSQRDRVIEGGLKSLCSCASLLQAVVDDESFQSLTILASG